METDLDDERQVERLQARLRKEGVERKLASLGARAGDEVEIRGRVFEYVARRGRAAGEPTANDCSRRRRRRGRRSPTP